MFRMADVYTSSLTNWRVFVHKVVHIVKATNLYTFTHIRLDTVTFTLYSRILYQDNCVIITSVGMY